MEALVPVDLRSGPQSSYALDDVILGFLQPGRKMDGPMREGCVDCIQPLLDSPFSGVDFLSAADQADDHSPVLMAVQAGDEVFRFRLAESGPVFLLLHEPGGLGQVPCTLSLIKQGHVLDWW